MMKTREYSSLRPADDRKEASSLNEYLRYWLKTYQHLLPPYARTARDYVFEKPSAWVSRRVAIHLLGAEWFDLFSRKTVTNRLLPDGGSIVVKRGKREGWKDQA